MELHTLTIEDAADALRARSISSVELTTGLLARTERLNPGLNAFISVTADLALLQARQADERLARGGGGPLTGIPVALKDVLSTEGVTTTCGSRVLGNYVPQYSATVVRRLFDAGCVCLGKTNMDEFAMGSSNENSGFGPVSNPWDRTRVPGGSSGGSAAAVAAGLSPFALGTDTGGSIRQPAALTGVVGLKPTYGRVSRFGLVAFASSLDQIGPLARTVRDAATVLGAIAGRDPLDSTSIDASVESYASNLTGDVRGLRLGVPEEYMGEGLDPDIRAAVECALSLYRDLGATVETVSLPRTDAALSAYYVIAPAEAMANLARFDGVRYGLSCPGEDIWELFGRTREAGFGAEVKRRVLLGTYALSAGYYDAYYLQAQKVRTLVREDFALAFSKVDALITPTTPTAAFPIGAKTDNPLEMYLSDVYTVPVNIAGLPGISVPAGFSGGLPIGLQVIGPALGEETILRVADAFQRHTKHHLGTPHLDVAA
jgi:aspartyl-tRNA(Asn)/glutamyl-tRNA(Gln) amidotransferase subunit A